MRRPRPFWCFPVSKGEWLAGLRRQSVVVESKNCETRSPVDVIATKTRSEWSGLVHACSEVARPCLLRPAARTQSEASSSGTGKSSGNSTCHPNFRTVSSQSCTCTRTHQGQMRFRRSRTAQVERLMSTSSFANHDDPRLLSASGAFPRRGAATP